MLSSPRHSEVRGSRSDREPLAGVTNQNPDFWFAQYNVKDHSHQAYDRILSAKPMHLCKEHESLYLVCFPKGPFGWEPLPAEYHFRRGRKAGAVRFRSARRLTSFTIDNDVDNSVWTK